MTKKHLENIMTVDDEVCVQLTKASLFLSSLSRKEDHADKRKLYLQALSFVSEAQECLNRVLLLEYPDLDDNSPDYG